MSGCRYLVHFARIPNDIVNSYPALIRLDRRRTGAPSTDLVRTHLPAEALQCQPTQRG